MCYVLDALKERTTAQNYSHGVFDSYLAAFRQAETKQVTHAVPMVTSIQTRG
jgi:hypothetical protein